MCREMSEEDHIVKRRPKQVIRDAVLLAKKDLKSAWIAIVLIGVYFLTLHFLADSSCPVVMVTGYPCPACGLTRAGIALLSGQFLTALSVNACIYPLALLAMLFLTRRYLLLKSTKQLKVYLIVVMVGMIFYYIYRMATQFPGDPPMSYYQGNFLRFLQKL